MPNHTTQADARQTLLAQRNNINLRRQLLVAAAGLPLAGTILVRQPPIANALHQKTFAHLKWWILFALFDHCHV